VRVVAGQRLWDGGRWVVGKVRWVTPVVLWEVAGGVDRYLEVREDVT
jgi:hypothetical protein